MSLFIVGLAYIKHKTKAMDWIAINLGLLLTLLFLFSIGLLAVRERYLNRILLTQVECGNLPEWSNLKSTDC